MDFWYGWCKALLGAYLKVFGIRAEVSGLEHLPQGPKIVVGNHPNATDSFHLPFLIREKMAALIDGKAFQTPVLGHWLRLAGQIPVMTGRGKEALQAAHAWLLRGNVVLIYPEGKLTNTYAVSRSGTGVARLALAANVPIVPFGVYVPEKYIRTFRGPSRSGRTMVGTWQIWGKTYIKIGPPVMVTPQLENEDSRDFYRRLTEEIMQTVASLAEQAQIGAGV